MRVSINTEYKMTSKKIQIFGVFFGRHRFLLNCKFVKTKAWLVVNNFSASMVAMSLPDEQILAVGTISQSVYQQCKQHYDEQSKTSTLAAAGRSAFGFDKGASVPVRCEQGQQSPFLQIYSGANGRDNLPD